MTETILAGIYMFDRVRSLQVAWFIPSDPPPANRLFTELLNTDPDQYQKLTPPQAPFPIVVQSVIKGDVQYRLQSQPGRIDFFIEGPLVGPTINLLSDPDRLVDETLTQTARLASTVGMATRLALILTMAENVNGNEAINQRFGSLFSGYLKGSSDRDLVFQLSRPTQDGEFNRLLRWQGESITVQQIINNGQAISSVETYYINYMIDVNTVPSPEKQFAPGQQTSAFKKLAELVKQLRTLERVEDFV